CARGSSYWGDYYYVLDSW
nr:immunoglobulin heavy chain junction region [Macaca mulatta]MOW75325.1 immunoglobulin heavy chain junction region [Macaca mulatta]MOW75685.1 immunoglobulin heavy chain junction region [Macaca mulatta]MOW75694.1 immunoglobulin heavy chain junction region [Macaca mulatta]MOW76389.1 immunoglobulin heavy chain junction region [Macaca mulatta]